jgi:hypothetical protein
MYLVGLPQFKPTNPPGLAYKGHGVVFKDAGPSATTMNYGTVAAGSAPSAGDLVVWIWFIGVEAYDNSPLTDWRRQSLTGSGWVQANQPGIPPASGENSDAYVASVLAKVVEAGDISSPPTIQPGIDADNAANYGMWVAYSVTGSIASLTIPAATRNSTGGSAPAGISVDSSDLSAPDLAISFAMAAGTDNSVQLSGIVLDKELTQNNLGEYFTGPVDLRVGVKMDVGGGSYTITKGDDGSANLLFAGYVAVEF